jgi:hypothetical protein
MHFLDQKLVDQVNGHVSTSECLQTWSKKFSCFHKDAGTIQLEVQIKLV